MKKIPDKCEICRSQLDDKNRESVTYRCTTTYICDKCMHRIITLMTVMKGYKEIEEKGIHIDLSEEIDKLKKIICKKID